MPVTPRFPDAMLVRDARAEFFRVNKFGEGGGYSNRWVKIKSKPVPIYLPNIQARVRAARLHDLHHLAAPYDTSWIGEAEIGAWEVGSGCRGYWAAWYLNLGAMSYGVVIAPRRVFRSFCRGRHTRNLYGGEFHDSLLEETVGSLRRRLRLDSPPPRASARDIGAFCAWSCVAVALNVWPTVAVVVLVVMGVWLWRG